MVFYSASVAGASEAQAREASLACHFGVPDRGPMTASYWSLLSFGAGSVGAGAGAGRVKSMANQSFA
jgi:hypothetical protein